VQNTGGEGILIDSMALGVVTNSIIQNNPGPGIKVAELASARIGANLLEDGGATAPNTISNNGGDGVLVTNKATAQIIQNTISGNGGNGISVAASASASTAGNLIDANKQSGIAAYGRSYAKLGKQDNVASPDTTVINNTQFGVACFSGAAVVGALNSINPLEGSLSSIGPESNAFDPTCASPANALSVSSNSGFSSLLEGEITLRDALPTPSPISYTTSAGQALTSNFGYPGFVEIITMPSTAATTVTAAILANGGSVSAAIPRLGLYVAKVQQGQEAAFLRSLYANSWLEDGAPLSPVTDAAQLVAIDSFSARPNTTNPCAQYHGKHVAGVMARAGDSVSTVDTGGWITLGSFAFHQSFYPRIAGLMTQQMESAFQNGQTAVINISIQSMESGAQPSTDQVNCTSGICNDVRREQLLFFMNLFQALEFADSKVAGNTLVVMASGNAGVDVDTQLQGLKTQFPNAWKRLVIVGATDQTGAIDTHFNSSGANMAYALGVGVNSLGDSCSGTSFAAPEVSRILYEMWLGAPSLTSDQVVAAFKTALVSCPGAASTGNIVPQGIGGGPTPAGFTTCAVAQAKSIASGGSSPDCTYNAQTASYDPTSAAPSSTLMDPSYNCAGWYWQGARGANYCVYEEICSNGVHSVCNAWAPSTGLVTYSLTGCP
jgi:hypothetical protein